MPRNNSASSEVTIQSLGLERAAEALPQLEALLNGAYHNSHMHDDLDEDIREAPEPFRLFVAQSQAPDTRGMAIGTAVVERKVHAAFDYLGLPPVHVKRFTVLDAFRGMGVGKRLLDECKQYGFGEAGLSALFVESNEIGALAMYGREGAMYSREAIGEYYRRNTIEDALRLFTQAITDPSRRIERYPNGAGIRFAFAGDAETAEFLRSQGYVSRQELIADVP